MLSGLARGSEDDDSQVSPYLFKDAGDKEVSRIPSSLLPHAPLPCGSVTWLKLALGCTHTLFPC